MNLQKTLRSLTIGLLFLIPIFPLIVANAYFFPFITGKAFYFRILVELAFASWIILAFLDVRYRPKFTALTIGVTLFALITLIADLLGVSVVRSIFSNFERMEGWLVIAHLWAFFMVITHTFGSDAEGKRNWHRWLNLSLIVAGITAIYGFAQLFGWAAIHQGSTRLDASLGNAAYFAVYMLMHTGLAAYLCVASLRNNARVLSWVYGIVTLIFSFLVFQTQTRGTILGLIGGILLALALYSLFAKKESKKSRIISGAIIGIIVLIGIVFWMNRDASFIQNNQTLHRIASISWNENKTQARGYIWPMAISGALERPIFGWGQENFNYIFNENYEPRMWSQEQWFDRAHSVYLDWFVASGFVGLFSYLALYVLFFIAIWRSTQLSVAEKSVLSGLMAGYMVHNVFVFDNLASYVFFFALLGFAGSVAPHSTKKLSKFSKAFSTRTFTPDAVTYVVVPIVVVALGICLYFINIRAIQANTRLITALRSCSGPSADPMFFVDALEMNAPTANQEIREQLITCSRNVISNDFSGQIKQGFFELSQNQIAAQIEATPEDARIYVLGGALMNEIGQAELALPLLEKAHELTPGKQSVAFQLANLYMGLDRDDEAVALLKQAYESDPTFPAAQSAYLTSLIMTGKENEAKEIFASSTGAFETVQVARAYAVAKQYTKAISIVQKLIAGDPTNYELKAQLAQIQYEAGMTWAAIQTLTALAKDHPELKSQVDQAIKQLEAGM